MRIEKWYFDCVTDAGAGLIGYAVRASWGPLALRCAETLAWTAGQPAQQRIALGGALPAMTSAGIEWRNTRLGVVGRWQPLAPALESMVLHDEDAGRIAWHCHCPAGRADVAAGGARYEGLGYVERLVLTLPSARWPMRELRWGRFIGETVNCVWIRWRGPPERAWCFRDGRAVDAGRPGAHEVTWNGGRLQLEPGTTIRRGRLADSTFDGAPWLRRLLPARVTDIEETKWCSRGVLSDAGGQVHAGWAVHELAVFP